MGKLMNTLTGLRQPYKKEREGWLALVMNPNGDAFFEKPLWSERGEKEPPQPREARWTVTTMTTWRRPTSTESHERRRFLERQWCLSEEACIESTCGFLVLARMREVATKGCCLTAGKTYDVSQHRHR
ncbi:hypothetical protein DEO72_LG3g2050 [Vigna unguiculata]|uniref:Uncharacterized protein n=1 Tax=Vigna unguiculata TaxID=3917 RepID=A0A4D6LH96_VIGUN|nr:hypothetical protein DEO72_LG3g2050 [Vigna unguiculata]